MIRATLAGTLLTGLIGGCASSVEKTLPANTGGLVDAATAAGLDSDSARRARWAGVRQDRLGEPVDRAAVVATARAPVHTLPTTASRLLGTLKQGGEVPVEELLLWQAPTGGSASSVDGDGLVPTWARVRIGDLVGYVPWTCLTEPDRYAARPPADVRWGAEMDLSRAAVGEFEMPREDAGGLDWTGFVATPPDRGAVDALVAALEPRFMPSQESTEALPTAFVDSTPADRFFFGREQAGRMVASMPSASPDSAKAVRLRAIGDAVANASRLPRPYADWVWVVLEAPDVVDCIAMPGGFVFATSGLLESVERDDELAAVLAREVARLEAGVAMPAIAAALAAREEALRRTTDSSDDSSDDSIGDSDRWSDVAATVDAMEGGPSPLVALADRSDKAMETSLDARGVALAAAAGFDPWALTELVVRMNERGLRMPGLRVMPMDALELAATTAAIVQARGEGPASDEGPAGFTDPVSSDESQEDSSPADGEEAEAAGGDSDAPHAEEIVGSAESSTDEIVPTAQDRD